MSCSSYWRIPRVRRIASRPIAKDVRKDLVEGRLKGLLVTFPACLSELPPALEVRMVALVLRDLLGSDRFADLVAERLKARANVGVAQGLDLRLEGVRLVDKGLDPLQLSIVGIDEAGQETKHGRTSIRVRLPDPPR